MVIIVFSLKFILRLYLQLTSLKKDNLIPCLQYRKRSVASYSTVTDLARFLG